MAMRSLLLLMGIGCLGFSGLAAAGQVPAVNCARPPFPTGTKLTVVAQQVAMNGTPMSILAMANRLPPAAVLDFYRHRWVVNGHPAYVQYRVGPWQVVAHRGGSCFYTVQVQAQGSGTEGLVGVSLPGEAQGMPGQPSFPAPSGTKVINDMASNDGGKIGHTWYLGNRETVQQNADFYLRTLVHQGWSRQIANHPPMSHGAVAMMFQKGAQTVSIVVEPAAFGSTLLITKVRR